MEIVNAYELVGSYRGAAALCGTTAKTVKRVLERVGRRPGLACALAVTKVPANARVGKTRRGSKWLRRALVEAGRAASRTKSCYFHAQYRRLAARRGPNKAALAAGHAILTTAYYLLTRQDTYRDISPTYKEERLRARTQRRAVEQLQQLGYQVALTPLNSAA
jgi:hypothetical protein